MSKVSVELKGWDVLEKKLNALGADIMKEQKEALIEARDYTNNKLREHVKNSHYDTGKLYNSIENYPPQVGVDNATICAGFNFNKGGWKSRFFLAGTPKMPKDQVMWNILYSAAEKIKRHNIMLSHLKKAVDNFGR